jgi:hypothetical protein
MICESQRAGVSNLPKNVKVRRVRANPSAPPADAWVLHGGYTALGSPAIFQKIENELERLYRLEVFVSPEFAEQQH